jgi:hypothetical protein
MRRSGRLCRLRVVSVQRFGTRSALSRSSRPAIQGLFLEDTRLADDSQAKGKWHTSVAGGIYYAVGIGGSVLVRGGDVILIDDPYSSMEDALSEVTRKNVWEWYTGTAYNRLMPNGAIVVINHRMHEDDLSGRLWPSRLPAGTSGR